MNAAWTELDSQSCFMKPTWWLIPLSKWVTTLVINGISGVSPLITGVVTHLLSGMNHQVVGIILNGSKWPYFRLVHFGTLFTLASVGDGQTEVVWPHFKLVKYAH